MAPLQLWGCSGREYLLNVICSAGSEVCAPSSSPGSPADLHEFIV